MIKLEFKEFGLSYSEDHWVDLNIDDESTPPEPTNTSACWLMPREEKDDYLRRGTCILIKEFGPEVDVVEREKHNEQVMREVESKLDINIFEPSSEDYLGFEEHLSNIVHSHYHKKVTEKGFVLYRAKYILQKQAHSLLVVIKLFNETAPPILNNINDVLKRIQ